MTKLLAAAALLTLSLSGCSLIGGGGSGGAGSGGSESTPGAEPVAEGGTTACVTGRDWSLNVPEQAAALAEMIATGGVTVVSTDGAGSHTIRFNEDGNAESASDITYTIVVDMGEGSIMTMKQHHEGDVGGPWAWDASDESDVITFNDWDTDDYTITTDTSIDGQAAPTSVSPGGGEFTNGTMTVSCEGDTLTTQAAGSPFTQTWTTD